MRDMPDNNIDSLAIPQTLVQSLTQPEGTVSLVYGDPLVFRCSMLAAAQSLCQGHSIAVVDGCNRFDVHAIIRYARERYVNPDALLKRIFVSRGFTCYQMEAAVTNKLPAFLEQINSNVAMIFGMLDTFYDEQASMREVQHILPRVLLALQRMKERHISLLLACAEWNVLPRERNQLFDTLRDGMDKVYHLIVDKEQKVKVFLEKNPTVILKRSA